MTIIEAIKSGKAFRRLGWGDRASWIKPKDHGKFYYEGESEFYSAIILDILADDWIVREGGFFYDTHSD